MMALQTLLRSRINGRTTPNGWVSFNCPMCVVNGQSRPDTKHRGGLMYSPDGGVSYQCFNCRYKTGWSPGWTLSFKMRKLLKTIGFDEADVQRLNLEILSQADVDMLKRKEPEPAYVPNWPDYNLEFDLEPLHDPAKIAYLESRQLLDLTTWFETGSEIMSMHRRIILPFTYENKLVGYTGRFLGTIEEEKKYGKYKKKSPANYVYGLDNQREQRQYVIVCEGEFDALLTSGLAIGSNSINDKQIQLIEDLNIEPIVVPDQDRAGKLLAEQAADYGWSVSFPDWEGCKDVGDAVKKYGRVFTVHSILQAAEHSPTKIRLLARRLGV